MFFPTVNITTCFVYDLHLTLNNAECYELFQYLLHLMLYGLQLDFLHKNGKLRNIIVETNRRFTLIQ